MQRPATTMITNLLRRVQVPLSKRILSLETVHTLTDDKPIYTKWTNLMTTPETGILKASWITRGCKTIDITKK